MLVFLHSSPGIIPGMHLRLALNLCGAYIYIKVYRLAKVFKKQKNEGVIERLCKEENSLLEFSESAFIPLGDEYPR